MRLGSGSTEISKTPSISRSKKFLDKGKKGRKGSKSFLLSPEVEYSCLLPEWSFTNQNICLEEKWLLTLSIEPCWNLADALLSCKKLWARKQNKGLGSLRGKKQEDRLLIPPPLNMLPS